MSENLLWIMAGPVIGFSVGAAASWAADLYYRRKEYDPIDYDALQAELDEEFAPISRRAM
jgi:hypothetical protein